MPLSLAILVSGRGSNMKAILEAIRDGALDAEVAVVLSNVADAPALETARSFGVNAVAVPHKGMQRNEHELAVVTELQKYKFDFVVLAGYMRILSPNFLKHFKHEEGYFKVINIHPSMLPAFPGASAYEDAFEAGVAESGITVHLVDELVDHGPILAQESFVRLESDTLEEFKARGLSVEHRLFPSVLQTIASKGLAIKEGRAITFASAGSKKGSDTK